MSAEIEAKVLSALLSDRYLLTRVTGDGFSPDIFRDRNFRIIFKTVHDLSLVPGQLIDWITVESAIKRKEWFSPEVGQALEELQQQDLPEADQIIAYVDILKDQSLRDKTMKLAQVMVSYCQRKGQYRNRAERRILDQSADAVAEILPERLHEEILQAAGPAIAVPMRSDHK